MKKNATGECFYNSYELVQNVHDRNAKLVHGIVWHEKTGYHVHGWVELNGFCFDTIDGRVAAIPEPQYYKVGKIKTGKGEIFKYTKEEARKLALKKGKYYFSKLPCKQ